MIVPEWVVHKLEFTQLRESENYAGLMKLINQELDNIVFGEDKLAALDYLSAVHLKSGDYNGAKQVAGRAIKCKKEDYRGYLRLAQAESAMGNYERVRKIYVAALDRVAPKTSGHNRLEGQYQKFLDKISGKAKRRDPIECFPGEVLDMIFMDMPLKTIAQCIKVCGIWRRYFSSRPHYWKTLDLLGARRDVRKSTLTSYLNWAQKQVTHLQLGSRLKIESTELCTLMMKACPNLRVLRIEDRNRVVSHPLVLVAPKLERLTHLHLNCRTNMETVTSLIQKLYSLEVLECSNIDWAKETGMLNWEAERFSDSRPNLKRLILGAGANQMNNLRHLNLESLGYTVRNLEELALHGWYRAVEAGTVELSSYGFKKLTNLVFNHCGLVALPKVPPTLTSITIARAPRLRNFENAVWPNIETIKISELAFLNEDILREILENNVKQPGQLKSLQIDRCAIKITPAEIASIIDVSGITSLSLSYLTDESSFEFKKYTSLTELDIKNTFITGIGLVNIAKTAPTLEVIDISGCGEIGYDAIDYVRENVGLNIINMRVPESKGGKVVRQPY